MNASTFQTYGMPSHKQIVVNYVTPVTPAIPSITNYLLPAPTMTTETNFYKHLSPVMKGSPKILKNVIPNTIHNDTLKSYIDKPPEQLMGNNITVFTPEDIDYPFKTIHPEPPLVMNNVDLDIRSSYSKNPVLGNQFTKFIHSSSTHDNTKFYPNKPLNIPDSKLIGLTQESGYVKNTDAMKHITPNIDDLFVKQMYGLPIVKKVPSSQLHKLNYFLPAHDKKFPVRNPFQLEDEKTNLEISRLNQPYFNAMLHNKSKNAPMTINLLDKLLPDSNDYPNHNSHTSIGQHVTVMKNKDLMAGLRTDIKSSMWKKEPDTHLLTKAPNPYETVLLKVPSNPKTELHSMFKPSLQEIPRAPSKTYSSLDFEHLLNQMELESEVNRNTGRSADKSHGTSAAGQ
ncbi:uncharacterized protein [Maniola hyperantus]|uniref:uncharacterized protein n=1 Tax=Aphantopus hyperantus TaxID=2795564 RepID=UPI0037496A25